MDKQICAVILSCMFATVYPQDTSLGSVTHFVKNELQQREQPLSLSDLLIYQPFKIMELENFLVQATAKDTSGQQFICTGIVKTQHYHNLLEMDGTHCSSDKPNSRRRQLINTNDFQKTINKAVDFINKGFPHMMFAAALREVKVSVTGCFSKILFSTFELTVAKAPYFNTAWIKAYGNTVCNFIDDNRSLSLNYSVRGVAGTLTDDPVVEIRFLVGGFLRELRGFSPPLCTGCVNKIIIEGR